MLDDRPVPRRGVDELERELKFVLPLGQAAAAEQWLRTVCRRDPQFPEADVWTVYYDTPDFESLDEKLNSDYVKTKFRLRFYAAPGQPPSGVVFAEMKRKIGSRRDKFRTMVPVDAQVLGDRDLQSLVFQGLPEALRGAGVGIGPAWTPMLTLRYRRSRLIEPSTGARVSIDRDVTAIRVNHRHLFASRSGPLPVAIVEVKGEDETLPPALRMLTHFGARKEAFSKYAALLHHVRRSAF